MRKLIIFGLLLFRNAAYAGIALEVDPLAYVMKGHSVHLLYQSQSGFVVDAGAFGLELPEAFEPNDGFRTKFNGYGLKFYYIGPKQAGFYLGAQVGRSKYTVTQENGGSEQKAWITSAGPLIGYRFRWGPLYFSPWIGYDFVFDPPELDFGSDKYKFKETNVFPTIHLGIQF